MSIVGLWIATVACLSLGSVISGISGIAYKEGDKLVSAFCAVVGLAFLIAAILVRP
jgi:hypothetical protein